MTLRKREIIYLGRANSIDLLLTENGSAKDLSSVTHAEMVISGVTYNSSSNPEYFSGVTSSVGEISLLLGGAGVTPGVYRAELIMYDTSNTSGVMWGRIPLQVKG